MCLGHDSESHDEIFGSENYSVAKLGELRTTPIKRYRVGKLAAHLPMRD